MQYNYAQYMMYDRPQSIQDTPNIDHIKEQQKHFQKLQSEVQTYLNRKLKSIQTTSLFSSIICKQQLHQPQINITTELQPKQKKNENEIINITIDDVQPPQKKPENNKKQNQSMKQTEQNTDNIVITWEEDPIINIVVEQPDINIQVIDSSDNGKDKKQIDKTNNIYNKQNENSSYSKNKTGYQKSYQNTRNNYVKSNK